LETQTSCDTVFSCQEKHFALKCPLFLDGIATLQPNVMVQWLVLLPRNREVPGSKFGPKPAILIVGLYYISVSRNLHKC
jgi:hypothetical protein